MSERIYMLVAGAVILVSLYMEIDYLIYGLASILMFEGLSNIRLTTKLQQLRQTTQDSGLFVLHLNSRFELEAFRLWRIVVSLVLVVPYAMMREFGYDMLWFFLWFMGFAIMGAGASGVCPVLLGLRWAGFR